MNLTYTQFQALSSCEAQRMQSLVDKRFTEAVQMGMNVILGGMSDGLCNFIPRIEAALIELGYTEAGAHVLAHAMSFSITDNKTLEASDE